MTSSRSRPSRLSPSNRFTRPVGLTSQPRTGRATAGRRRAHSTGPTNAYPKPWTRADEARAFGVVAEHAPELGHQAVQRHLRDERIGPQLRMDVGLRHGGRPPLDQERQEIEGLAREVMLDTVTRHPARSRIELDAVAHRSSLYAAERRLSRISCTVMPAVVRGHRRAWRACSVRLAAAGCVPLPAIRSMSRSAMPADGRCGWPSSREKSCWSICGPAGVPTAGYRSRRLTRCPASTVHAVSRSWPSTSTSGRRMPPRFSRSTRTRCWWCSIHGRACSRPSARPASRAPT